MKEKRKQDKSLLLRMTKAEHREFIRLAETEHIPLGMLIRKLLHERIEANQKRVAA